MDEVLQRFGVTRPTQPPVQQLAQRMDVGQQSAQPQPQGRGANRQVEQWMEAEFEKRQAQQKELRNESKGYESNSGNLLNVMPVWSEQIAQPVRAQATQVPLSRSIALQLAY